MSDYATLRLPLSERLPIATYTNLSWPLSSTVWMSPQAERITGYPLARWVGNPGFFESVLHPADRDAVLGEADAARRDVRVFSADYRLVARDGRVIWIHDESVPIVDTSGRLELMQGYFIDITERKQLEEQLLHSQRTGELGRLAGTIAHDFNNYLVVIRAYADLLAPRLPGDGKAQECVREIAVATERAGRLTKQLLAFGRRKRLEPCRLALGEIVRELEPMLARVAGECVEIEYELRPAPPVHADAGQLEQVLVNLVANARDAMADGGLVAVGVDAATVDPGERSGRLALPPGRYAVLSVRDHGAGMDAETRSQALDPFFTTKSGDRGTGLGLAIVDGVVRQSRGAIDIESAPGRGTHVRIFLPAAPPALRSEAPGPSAARPPG